MKFRRIIIWLLLLSVWGGTMIFANETNQKVRVVINGIDQEDGGFIIDGKTYLPLRQLASSMQALTEWDKQGKIATVYKPNVHMFLYQNNSVFGNVDRGYQAKFKVFSQIDNLMTEISQIKVSIFDPSGKERVIQTETINQKTDNFWFVTEEIEYKFDSLGKYPVRFFIKVKASDDWTAVSEKLITSRAP